MIRLLIDPKGDGHSDLWLKIDAFPTFSQTADSYYLGSESESVPQKAKNLLLSWIEKIEALEMGQSVLLAFDVSDEYISGFRLTCQKKGLFIQYLTARDTVFDSTSDFLSDSDHNWLLDKNSVLENLDWSLRQIG